MSPELELLSEVVTRAAREELCSRFGNNMIREFKADGSIVTIADRAMQDRLARDLKQHWPTIPLLGEEMDGSRQLDLAKSNCHTGIWCLDPLDGTTNFSSGVPIFAVSLALVRNGGSVLGVIYDPNRDECFAAESGRGAWCNGVKLQIQAAPQMSDCLAVMDLKRLPAPLARHLIESPPYGSQRNFGSCALEWAWLAAGRFHLYLHGGQAPWDYAAGLLILREAGGQAITIAGEPVFNDSLESRSVVATLDPEALSGWHGRIDNILSSSLSLEAH